MSWCSCDCGDGACFSGALSLPSSRGTWNVLLVTGLLAAALARGCRCLSLALGAAGRLSLRSCCWLAGWSSLPKAPQTAAA